MRQLASEFRDASIVTSAARKNGDVTAPPEGNHQPKKVLAQFRQFARDPSMMMSRCRRFLQTAQRCPELSGTSCLQAVINSRLPAAPVGVKSLKKSPVAYFRWGFSCSCSSNCSRSIPAIPRQSICRVCSVNT